MIEKESPGTVGAVAGANTNEKQLNKDTTLIQSVKGLFGKGCNDD